MFQVPRKLARDLQTLTLLLVYLAGDDDFHFDDEAPLEAAAPMDHIEEEEEELGDELEADISTSTRNGNAEPMEPVPPQPVPQSVESVPQPLVVPQAAEPVPEPSAAPQEAPEELGELHNKFHRLLMTLQQLKTNDQLQAFMLTFQQNVDKAAARQPQPIDTKRALYYARIHDNVPDDSFDALNASFDDADPHHKSPDPLPTVAGPDDEHDHLSLGQKLGSGPSGGLGLSVDEELVELVDDEDDLLTLFVRLLHPFDALLLQLNLDALICLSFDKDELAFVHTIDESGWGEVTLVELLQRGWVPMNYFAMAVIPGDDDEEEEDEEERDGIIPNSHYLRPLFHACGKFLINPLSHRNSKGKFTFSLRTVNLIRDGVRLLLQYTDCLLRLNEIVTKRPVVRKLRKLLLADWYNLMVKANEFKGTLNFGKIEILTLMVYQVTTTATIFLQVWLVELRQVIKRDNEKRLQLDMNNYPLLAVPPLAKTRITEINSLLYTYLGLIIGRLDLVEHNPIGCDILETLTHQIILLLRELLFISKTGLDFSNEKPLDLDALLDTLLLLVLDLVLGVKNLVVKTLNELLETHEVGIMHEYYYTPEGGDLIQVALRIIRLISKTIALIRKLLEVTGDFKLNLERLYPDYSRIKIEPQEFIRKCTLGIAKLNLAQFKQHQPIKPMQHNRYSLIRAGKTGELGITPGGANILHDVLLETEGASPFAVDQTPLVPIDEQELQVDQNGNLIGALFRGLVYTLTNETSPPDYFFVLTFFLCFRLLALLIDLTEELIQRFEPQGTDTTSSHMRNRRRLIVKMFQLWMELYWNAETDFSILTTLINFFNEGVLQFLPLDAMKLMEIAVKLLTRPLLVENEKKVLRLNRQLVIRLITAGRKLRKTNHLATVALGDELVDQYELAKIHLNLLTELHQKNEMIALPQLLLLLKQAVAQVEHYVMQYRKILGESWTSLPALEPYQPIEPHHMLALWYALCQQAGELPLYRPQLLEFNGLEIAKQLTILELYIFCVIKPDELLNQNFSLKRAHLRLAPNIRLLLLFTNCLSGYVLELILQPGLPLKARINMLKTWLKVAILCLYLRNFNSLAAIITSLQSHLITRLTEIWDELTPKYRELYDYLASIIHPDKNYHVYRSKLKQFLVVNSYAIPIVPYFSLFLQDLTFVTDGNPNYRRNPANGEKLINIDKYLKITRIIADIELLQISYTGPLSLAKRGSNSSNNKEEDYFIHSLPALQELILLELYKVHQLNKHNDDRAWGLSCAIHPREQHHQQQQVHN